MSKLIDDLRKLNKDELMERKSVSLAELKKIKFALKSGDITAENVNKARQLKDEVAKISTVLKEMDLIKKVENEN